MKKLVFIISVLFASQITWAKTQKACFNVEGMTCAACTVTTKVAIKKLEGIKDIDVSLENKSAIVNYDDGKTDPLKIKGKIDSVGYKATQRQCEEG